MEQVLMYNLETKEHGIAMTHMLEQFGIQVKHVARRDLTQQVGYLLELPGYARSNEEVKPFLDEFIVFHNFAEEQLELVLQVFEMAGIPYIAYKAKTTDENIELSFTKLFENVKEEFKSEYH